MKILEHVMTVMDAVFFFLHPDASADPRKTQEIEDRVRLFVSRRAPYSMLVRSVVARFPAIRPLFD